MNGSDDEFDDEFSDLDVNQLDLALRQTESAHTLGLANASTSTSMTNRRPIPHPPRPLPPSIPAKRFPATKSSSSNTSAARLSTSSASGVRPLPNGRAGPVPPRKRQRLSAPAPASDDEELPEITVGTDGGYAVNPVPSQPQPRPSIRPPSRAPSIPPTSQFTHRPSVPVSQSNGVNGHIARRSGPPSHSPYLPQLQQQPLQPRPRQDAARVVQRKGPAPPGLQRVDDDFDDDDDIWKNPEVLDRIEAGAHAMALTASQKARARTGTPPVAGRPSSSLGPAHTIAEPNGLGRPRMARTNSIPHRPLSRANSPQVAPSTSPSRRPLSDAATQVEVQRLEASLARYKQRVTAAENSARIQAKRAAERAVAEARKNEQFKNRGRLLDLEHQARKLAEENRSLQDKMLEATAAHERALQQAQRDHADAMAKFEAVDQFNQLERHIALPANRVQGSSSGVGSQTGTEGLITPARARDMLRPPPSRSTPFFGAARPPAHTAVEEDESLPDFAGFDHELAALDSHKRPKRGTDKHDVPPQHSPLRLARETRGSPRRSQHTSPNKTPTRPKVRPRPTSASPAIPPPDAHTRSSQEPLFNNNDDLGDMDINPHIPDIPVAPPGPSLSSSESTRAANLLLVTQATRLWAAQEAVRVRSAVCAFVLSHQSAPSPSPDRVPITMAHRDVAVLLPPPVPPGAAALSFAATQDTQRTIQLPGAPRCTSGYPPMGSIGEATTLVRILGAPLPPGLDASAAKLHATLSARILRAIVPPLSAPPALTAAAANAAKATAALSFNDSGTITTEVPSATIPPVPPALAATLFDRSSKTTTTTTTTTNDDSSLYWSFWASNDDVLAEARSTLTSLARALRSFAGLTLRLGMYDAFADTLHLCASTATLYPEFAKAFVKPTPTGEGGESETQFLVAPVPQQDNPATTTALPLTLPLPGFVAELLSDAAMLLSGNSPSSVCRWNPHQIGIDTWIQNYAQFPPQPELQGPHSSLVDVQVAQRETQVAARTKERQALLSALESPLMLDPHVEDSIRTALVALIEALVGALEIERGGEWALKSIASAPGLLCNLLNPGLMSDQALHGVLATLALLLASPALVPSVIQAQFAPGTIPRSLPRGIVEQGSVVVNLLTHHLMGARMAFAYAQNPEEEVTANRTMSCILSCLHVLGRTDRQTLISTASFLDAITSLLAHDADTLWSDPAAVPTTEAVHHIVERLHNATSLLSSLALPPSSDQDPSLVWDLSKALDSPLLQLNGARHVFTVALAQVAFAEDPEWLTPLLDSQTELSIQDSAELASSLLELVVDPEDLDQMWRLLVDPDAELDETADPAAP